MIHKVTVGIGLDPDEGGKLDKIAKDRGMTRSEVIDLALGKCADNPKLIGEIVKGLLSRQSPEAKKRKTMKGVSVTPKYIDKLDEVAAKLVLSRNTLLNLIIGGINHNLV